MDDTFAASLRGVLVERVNDSFAARRARRRRRAIAGVVVLALAGGGTALATGAFNGQPGSERSTQVAAPMTVAGTGTRTIHVRQPPPAANHLQVSVTCYTAGTIVIRDSSSSIVSATCDTRDLKNHSHLTQEALESPVDLHPNGVSVTVSTDAGDRWKLTAVYVDIHSTPWAVNARGQTYGVPNDHGPPDLFAVVATNGQSGYAYADQYTSRLNAALHGSSTKPEGPSQGPNLINVYRSDGTTLVGHYNVGPPYRFTFAAQGSSSHWLRYVLLALLITAAGLTVGYGLLMYRRRRTVSTP